VVVATDDQKLQFVHMKADEVRHAIDGKIGEIAYLKDTFQPYDKIKNLAFDLAVLCGRYTLLIEVINLKQTKDGEEIE